MSDDPFRENPIQNWREMAGELNEIEVKSLQQMELHGSTPTELLAQARQFASKRLLRSAFQSVSPPDDAVRWLDFQGVTDDDTAWEREFFCAERDFGGLRVRVQGRQRTDGTIAGVELLASGHAQLSAEECRQLAAALFAEADEIDRLTSEG